MVLLSLFVRGTPSGVCLSNGQLFKAPFRVEVLTTGILINRRGALKPLRIEIRDTRGAIMRPQDTPLSRGVLC